MSISIRNHDDAGAESDPRGRSGGDLGRDSGEQLCAWLMRCGDKYTAADP